MDRKNAACSLLGSFLPRWKYLALFLLSWHCLALTLLAQFSITGPLTSNGYIERETIVYNPIPPPPASYTLGAALNQPDLVFTTSGDAPWFGQSSSSFDGIVARSGNIDNNQSSVLETTVEGPAIISFLWEVNSEFHSDSLQFYIDDVWISTITAFDSNYRFTYELEAGSHTLKWVYFESGLVETEASGSSYYHSPYNWAFASPDTSHGIVDQLQITPVEVATSFFSVGLWPGHQRVTPTSLPIGNVDSDIYVSENSGYLALGAFGLQIIDVSDPANPLHLGYYDTMGRAEAVCVVGNYAYVADGVTGVQILDVSNPANPARVGGYDTAGYAAGISVVGGYAYVADTNTGLQILDVSNPANPIHVSSALNSAPASTEPWPIAKDVHVIENYAYVAGGRSGLHIIDISDPTNPITLSHGTLTFIGINSVIVAGNFAYALTDSSELRVIDVSDPSNPVWLGVISSPQIGDVTSEGDIFYQVGHDLHVFGSHAYVASAPSGLLVFDISNPSSPVTIPINDPNGPAFSIQVVGNLAYVVYEKAQLNIIDISNPTSPIIVGGYDTSGLAKDVKVFGNFAYVADDYAGLQIIDISNPTNPIRTGRYDTSGNANSVHVADSLAYVADGYAGLQIIDIRNPFTPAHVGVFDTSGFTTDVQTVGYLAYLADGGAGLQIIDVSNPYIPNLLGGLDTSGNAKAVHVMSNFAYLADGSSGLQIIDVSNPTNPVRVGGYDTTGIAYHVQVVGSLAYVADGSAGLQIIDITNPTNPIRVGGYDTSGTARRVHVVDGFAYVSDGERGLQVLDVHNPAQPSRVAKYYTGEYTNGVHVSGGIAYLTDSSWGLIAVDVNMIVNNTPHTLSPIGPKSSEDFGIPLTFTVFATDPDLPTQPLTFSLRNALPGATIHPTTGVFSWTPPMSLTPGIYTVIIEVTDGIFTVSESVAITITPRSPRRSPTPSLTPIGNWPARPTTSIHSVFISENRAYVTNDRTGGFAIFDISDPSTPVLIGSDTMIDSTNAIYVVGNYAYVASPNADLHIFDVSNPTNIFYVGGYNTPADDVAVVGNYAYVAAVSQGLQIIDVSDPATPVRVGEYIDAGISAVTVIGNYAYTIAGYYLEIIDISDPTFPIRLGRYSTGGVAYDVAVIGNYAYVAAGSTGLHIVDVSNPTIPVPVGGHNTDGTAYDVAVIGDYAYVSDGSEGLQVINVSNPSFPIAVQSYFESDNCTDVVANGNHAYLANGTSGLQVLDVSNPSLPIHVGGYDPVSFARDVTVVGNYAYVADDTNGLHIIDISNPVKPIRVGGYDTSGSAYSVFIAGDYAYVADDTGGLQIIDVHDPANPTYVANISGGRIRDVQVVDNSYDTYAYVVDDYSFMRIIDVSDPANPSIRGTHYVPRIAKITIVGNYAYVSARHGLYVFDITFPSSPSNIGIYDGSTNGNYVSPYGTYALVPDWNRGIGVFNTSNSLYSNYVSHLNIVWFATDVAVPDSYPYYDKPVFIVDSTYGLLEARLFFTSRLNPPQQQDIIPAKGISVAGNKLYVAQDIFGLAIYHINGLPNNPPTLSPIGPKTVTQGATLAFTASATDTDLPAQPLTFSLSDAPEGATIHPTTGAFSWPTSTALPPGFYYAIIEVSDGLSTVSEYFVIFLTPATNSQTWLADNLPPETPIDLQTLLADADFDGISNLLEYAMGADPAAFDPQSAPTLTMSENGQVVNFVFTCRSNDPALAYTIEVSSDLINWTQAALTFDHNTQSWSIDSPSINIQSATPLGNGIWQLNLRETSDLMPVIIQLKVSHTP